MIYDFEKNVPEIHSEAWVASNASIIGKVKLEKNSSIWFNAVLRGDIEFITIGEKVLMYKMVVYFTPTQVIH